MKLQKRIYWLIFYVPVSLIINNKMLILLLMKTYAGKKIDFLNVIKVLTF